MQPSFCSPSREQSHRVHPPAIEMQQLVCDVSAREETGKVFIVDWSHRYCLV